MNEQMLVYRIALIVALPLIGLLLLKASRIKKSLKFAREQCAELGATKKALNATNAAVSECRHRLASEEKINEAMYKELEKARRFKVLSELKSDGKVRHIAKLYRSNNALRGHCGRYRRRIEHIEEFGA